MLVNFQIDGGGGWGDRNHDIFQLSVSAANEVSSSFN